MASVERRPSGKWQVRWREGSGKARAKTFTEKPRALAFKRHVENQQESGGLILTRKDVPTLEEAAMAWIKTQGGLEQSSIRLYSHLILHHIVPDLGHLSLVDLTPARLEEWQQKLDVGAPTVQKARGILGRILNRAVVMGYMSSNPLSVIKGPRQPPKKSLLIATPEQIEGIRSRIPSHATMLSLIAYVGLRPPQEPTALMWGDYEGEALHIRRKNAYGVLKRHTKTERSRVVRLPAPVAQEMNELRLRQGRHTGLIFSTKGQPISKSAWDSWRVHRFRPAAKDVGLPDDFTPYSLRHTAASLMLASGWDISQIAEQLGHSVSVCANTYLHLVPAYRDQPKVDLETRIRQARGQGEGEVSEFRA